MKLKKERISFLKFIKIYHLSILRYFIHDLKVSKIKKKVEKKKTVSFPRVHFLTQPQIDRLLL